MGKSSMVFVLQSLDADCIRNPLLNVSFQRMYGRDPTERHSRKSNLLGALEIALMRLSQEGEAAFTHSRSTYVSSAHILDVQKQAFCGETDSVLMDMITVVFVYL